MLRRSIVALCLLVAAALAWASPAMAGPKIVLVYGSSVTLAPFNDTKAKLDALKLFDKVDVLDATSVTPTLAKLKEYDAIFLGTESSVGFGDPVTLGNNIAKFVDEGGGLVMNVFWMYYGPGGAANNLQGELYNKYRFANTTYSYSNYTGRSLGMKLDPTHPVLQGVNMVSTVSGRCYMYTGYNTAATYNGAKVIATWNDGNAAVVVGTRRVDLQIGHGSSDSGTYGCWNGKDDSARLIANALLWVANPLRASPSSVDFGDVGVMTSSAPQTVRVTNNGSAPIVVQSGAVAPAGEFTVTLNGGATLPLTLNAGDSFTFDAKVRPGSKGPRQAIYTLTPMAGGSASPLSVALTANGIGPRLGLNPATVDFGGIAFAGAGMTETPAQNIQFANSGGGQVRIRQITLTDMVNFSFTTAAMLPSSLLGGAAISGAVKFTPQAKGRFTATIDVLYDLVGEANDKTASISLVGTAGDPKLEIPAKSIVLQPIRVGKTGGIEYITITNAGLAPLTIKGLMLGGANPGDYVLVSKPGDKVAPNGGQYDILVQFAPKMAGLRTTVLSINSDDPMTPNETINLSAEGTIANFAIDKMSIDFSNGGMTKQSTGTCSAAVPVTITNSGNDALNIDMLSFDGTNPGSFRQSASGRRVPGFGGKLSIPVSFCPVSIGMQTANLVIVTDLMAGHTFKVPLTGIGTGPRVTANPGMVQFGGVFINTTHQGVMITLKNEGDQPLTFVKTTPPAAPFRLTNAPADNSTLAAGATHVMSVTVTPTESKPYTGSIDIQVNDLVHPMGVLRIPLEAIGSQANILVQPKQMMFPVTGIGVKSQEQTLSVQNTGTIPLTGMMVTITGQNAADFGFSGDVPMSLDGGKTVSFKVYFRPSGASARTAFLVIRANGLQVPEQIKLDGTGKAISVSCTPDYLQFGSLELGQTATKQVICSNMDNSPVDLDLLFEDFQDDWKFEAESTTLPGATAGEEGTLPVKITFTPTMTGVRNSRMLIKSKDSGIVLHSVDLEAVAIPMKMDPGGMGCKCSTGGRTQGGAAATGLLVGLGLLVTLLRRRRR